MKSLTIREILEGKTGFFDYINDDSHKFCIDIYSCGKRVEQYSTVNEDEYYNKLAQTKEADI